MAAGATVRSPHIFPLRRAGGNLFSELDLDRGKDPILNSFAMAGVATVSFTSGVVDEALFEMAGRTSVTSFDSSAHADNTTRFTVKQSSPLLATAVRRGTISARVKSVRNLSFVSKKGSS